jgi:uncharacterized repeat protein (TIGR04052 family)
MASSSPRSNLAWILAVAACIGCGDDAEDGAQGPQDAIPAADAATPMDSGARTDASSGPGADARTSGAGAAAPAAMQDVTIRFKARVGSVDFACGMTYANQGTTGVTVEPSDFRFYVQDLALVTADGGEVPVQIDDRAPWQAPEVALLDFEDGTHACAGTPEMNDRITGKVPQGTYVGVAFTNGVPIALNHADPTTLPAPLQVAALQWSWLIGYRFMKAELVEVLDDDADAGTIAGVGFLHSGSAACSGAPGIGMVSCAMSNRNRVRLSGFDPATGVIVADIGAIFTGSDLGQQLQCHGLGPGCGPMYERVGVDPNTGEPLSTQQVYSVE